MKKKLEKYNYLLILCCCIYTFIISVLFIYDEYVITEKVASIGLLLFLPFLILIYIFNKKKTNKFDLYDYLIIALIVLGDISVLTAINPSVAMWGRIGRYEGFFSILTYYFLFLDARMISKEKYKKTIFISLLIIGIMNAIYALFQTGILPTNEFIMRPYWYAQGFIGNSNMYASLMSLIYPLSISLFYFNNDKKKEIFYLLIMLLLSFGSLLSGAMSLFIGLIFIIILLIINLFRDDSKKNFYKFYKFVIIILCLVGPYILINNIDDSLSNDISILNSEVSSISQGDVEDDYGSGRMHIWKNTLKKIKEKPLTGFGIENFDLAFNFELILFDDPDLVVDKAHNDYLERALCQGIPSCLVFIALLLIIFFTSFKNKLNKYEYGLFLSFTCYSIVAFFNISMIRVAPLYFVIMGLLISYRTKD